MSHDTVVGLDVHADSITAAILPPGCEHTEMVKLPADLRRRLNIGPLFVLTFLPIRLHIVSFLLQRLDPDPGRTGDRRD
jgi:hypothetical protein